MTNPFIKISPDNSTQYVTDQCSINKLVLKKLPVYGLEDDIEGKQASDIFSRRIIASEIEKYSDVLSIDMEKNPIDQLPLQLEYRLQSPDANKKMCATAIAKKFGTRLGLVLLTLKLGDVENRQARPDWDDAHWDYWAGVENVIIVGGLASGLLGQQHLKYAMEVFARARVKPYNIIAFENASHVGVMGCAKLIKASSGINIVLDFGQTSIKRSIVRRIDGEICDVINLTSVPSKFMNWDMDNHDEKLREAIALHRYLIHTIVDTYRYAQHIGDVGDEIIISIASYTVDGCLNDKRGGYSKLTQICKNYAECITEELSGALKRQMIVKLVHDGTAVAMHFSDYQNSVCVTLGTYFGVGFPEIDIKA